eukprot:tig00021435_g21380.t1
MAGSADLSGAFDEVLGEGKMRRIRWVVPHAAAGLSSQFTSTLLISGTYEEERNQLALWNFKIVGGQRRGAAALTDTAMRDIEKLGHLSHRGDVEDVKSLSRPEGMYACVASSLGEVGLYAVQPPRDSLDDTPALLLGRSWSDLHRGPCATLDVDPDEGTEMASGGQDGRLVVTSLLGPAVSSIENADPLSVHCVRYASRATAYTAGSFLRLWDLRSPESAGPIFSLPPPTDLSLVECLAVHPVRRSELVAVRAGRREGWRGELVGGPGGVDARQPRAPLVHALAHNGDIWDVQFHPARPDLLLTCGEDGAALAVEWSAELATVETPPCERLFTNEFGVNSIDVHPDTQAVVCSTDSEALRFRFPILPS